MLVEISFNNGNHGDIAWQCKISRVDANDPDLHDFTSSILTTEHWEGDILFLESQISYQDIEHADADVEILSDQLRAFIHRGRLYPEGRIFLDHFCRYPPCNRRLEKCLHTYLSVTTIITGNTK